MVFTLFALSGKSGLWCSAARHFRRITAGACVLAVLSYTGAVRGDETSSSAANPVDGSIKALTAGNYASAAQQIRQALAATPDDAMLNTVAGAIALNSGSPGIARSAFERALQAAPQDSLALYGSGLAQLAAGNRAAAMASFDRSDAAGGDRTVLLIARRYAQWLNGAQLSVEGAALPDALLPAQNSLRGMDAARHGDWKQAAGLLENAVSSTPGDAILQPVGLLMDFERDHPVTTAGTLPEGSLKVASDKGIVTGSVEFSPGGSLDGVAYVAYELDGQPLGLVNIRPFVYTWDSHRTKNGKHTLTVVLHDSSVREIGRTTRDLRVYNSDNESAGSEDAGAEQRAALWQALALHPDRCAAAYTLGQAYRAMGQPELARLWFARAVAIQPDYRDARKQWLAAGGAGNAGSALWGGIATEKVIALTFDDGPKPGVTEPLLDILKQERVPATFFVIGRHVMEYPDLTRQITASGMEIANHSYTHRNLTHLSDTEVTEEVMRTQAAIRTVTGQTPRFLRPPGGNWNPRVAQLVRNWGLTPCMWTVDVYGSEVIGAQQVANAVLAEVRPGSIILMHNGKVSTLQALPTIIRELRKRGYSFATVDTVERRLSITKAASRFGNGEIRSRAE